MAAPIIIKSIPPQIVNEMAAYGPFDLTEYIQAVDEASALTFRAELANGAALPQGMICTEDGLLTGIPAKGTNANLEIKITASNAAGSVETTFPFTIKPGFGAFADQPITVDDVYYLLERWATLTIWDALNLEPPSEKHLLQLEGASAHYNVYDRGSCLVANPKDLFSEERTTEDALQTARAMAREVYQRGWIIEFAGFDKMQRAAWVEIQHLEDVHGRKLEILHYDPTFKELRIYNEEAREQALRRAAEQP